MDNRLGCYVAYEAARLVAEAGGAAGDVVAVAAVQEEITFGGARTTAYALQPDAAIVVDVTFATDQPGIEVKELGKHAVRLRAGDRARLRDQPGDLRRPARHGGREGDPVHHQLVRRAGRAPTPTRCTSPAAASRAGSSALPLRYMHSPVEMVQISDVQHAAQLIAAYALSLPADASFAR